MLINTVGQDRNWIRFRVLNHHDSDAIGATVTLTIGEKRLLRYVKVAGSYLSAHDPHVHFGLGDVDFVSDVEVQWPTGETREFGDFDANQIVVLRPND